MKFPCHSPQHQHQSGQTLIEIAVVIVLLSLLAIPFLGSLNNLNLHFAKLATYSKGLFLTQKNLEIAANLIQHDWKIIKNENNELNIVLDEPYHLEKTSNRWVLTPGIQQVATYTTQITFHPICRSSTLSIIDCNSPDALHIDTNSIQAVSSTEWTYQNQPQSTVLNTIYTYLF